MTLGQRKQLDVDDVWPLRWELQANTASYRFSSVYEASRSMYKASIMCFGRRIFLTGVTFLVSMLCNLLGPVVLKEVVSSLSVLAEEDPNDETAILQTICIWVATLFAAKVLQALADTYARFYSEIIAIKLVASVKTLIFRKTLKLNAQARRDKSTGAITNMYTADSDAILATAFLVHQLWFIPLQIAIVSYMLYDVLGVAALAGVSVIVAMLGVNHVISKWMFACQRVYRRSKDVRMKKVTEVFKAVEIVKFNAWEERLMGQIKVTRAKEMKDLFKRRLLACLSVVMLWGMPVFISVASFGVYAGVMQRTLTPAIVFTSIALFQLIQGPLRMITNILPMLVQSKVALERIGAFLEMSELESDSVMPADHPQGEHYVIRKVIVAVEGGEFGWDQDSTLLRNVNLEVKAGEFVVLHGSVGCGKSSLCSALLGEMVKHNGTVFVGGCVAYCSQQPWIQNMTVRDNILFGLLYDRKKYEKVLDACALTADLDSLIAGDSTEIGERGINLSGGQKARIALARACYSDASVFLLDSPLSAVDAIIQNEIFQKCMLGLLKNKTIILVTHNPEIIESPHISRAVTIDELGALVETHHADNPLETEMPLVSPFAAQPYGAVTFGAKNDGENGHGLLETDLLIDKEPRTDDDSDRSNILNLANETNECDDEMALISPCTPCAEAKPRALSSIAGDKITDLEKLGKLVDEEERVRDNRPARELQRLSKTTQAPVLNHLSETVDGGAVIRAYGRGHVHRFQVTHSAKLDENNKIWFGQLCVSQWFSLHIQLVGSLLVLVVTASLVLLRHQLGAAVIGLAFSYALKVSQNLERLVQALSQVEPMMVSPERLQEYADIIQEAPSRLPLDPPSKIHPKTWPSAGSIEFNHVNFRYKDQGQLVLRDLSFSVHGSEKLGIVGRTGAGKSSLTMALFRINELAAGSIYIDGVDVSTIGLTTLREKLSIIPQNPVLFKGTLRNYLDPFDDFSDDELWTCLRQVGLGSRIETEDGKLDALVEENGENYSVGERQMLCMVCSLLRKSRIVIFDEATAAVDHATDQALQRVIREVFKDSTVLSIAHRLDTILDSDRILVMDDGSVKELASPAELIRKGEGHFFDLMEEGGYLDRFQQNNVVIETSTTH
ncbi:WW domain-binding protein 4 [Phytophthora nicotianae]|uniref:WW domain-binding protein 4 n=1 Tax=Phytophthora nicotianae TaxID=4792 RepID=A0A0W8CXG8_PHYNI|nr:WW domain-binding protein 4 [Phytophthora nicotianae]